MSKTLVHLPLELQIVPDFPWNGLFTGIHSDRCKVDACLESLLIPNQGKAENPVPRAMEYAAMGRAQRIRPILALRIARILRAETRQALHAAAAVELVHSASLIIDDLPCMDNESMRRGRPSVHREFGEPTAILAAFSMVGMAARIVFESSDSEADCQRLQRFQMALLRTLDCASLVGGQSMDLTLVGSERERLRQKMNEMKTVPLFQLAVEAGCVSNPAGVPQELEAFGKAFGVAFQLTDDYLDGELHDRKILDDTYEQCRAILQAYGENVKPLFELVDYLAERTHA